MSNNAASNVIAMREFDRTAPSQQAAQFDRLLKECQDLALDRLSRFLQGLADTLSTACFANADNAGVGFELHDVAQEVRPMTAAGGQDRRIG